MKREKVMLLENRKTEIEQKFLERMNQLGEYGLQITRQAAVLECDVKVAVQYLYITMPLSDAADYEFSVFEDYARHGVYLWEHGNFRESIPEAVFLNYILFHRINEEDISPCRSFFYREIKEEINPASMKESVLNLNYWCAKEATYRTTDERTVSPMTVYRCAYGRCGEESTFTVSVLRSAGIPARQVYAPRWSHCDDNHAWVEVWCDGEWYFLGACEPEEILNKGWFTNAASRAMMIHSRCFELDGSDDDICETQGCAVLYNQLKRYADTRAFTVKVTDADGVPVNGAVVDVEVLNYCECCPVASRKTDEQGMACFTTGKGTVHLHVHQGDIYQEAVIGSDVNEVAVILKEEEQCKVTYTEFDMIAPVDTPVNTDQPTKEQKTDGEVKLKQAIKCREEKIKKFRLEEVQQILDSGEPLAERMIQVLSAKDYRDCKAEVVLEHLREAKAYEDRYEQSVFDSYVLSPRIYFEPMTAYRKELNTCFTEEEKAEFRKHPKQIWRYIQKEITEAAKEEFPGLTISPVGCMKVKKGSMLSKKILFVAICRTLGIAARVNPDFIEAEYYSDGSFLPVEQDLERTELLHLIAKEKEFVWKYEENWTVARLQGGIFTTLRLKELQWSDGTLTLRLPKGTYRILTGNRLPNGNIFGVKQVLTLDGTGETVLPMRFRQAGLCDMLEEIEVLDYELSTESGETAIASNILKNKDSLVVFLEEGKEPTEHILNELYDKSDEFNQLDIQILFVVRSAEAFKDPTLIRTLEKLKQVQFYFDDFSELVEKLARRMYVDPEKLPLVIVFRDGLTGVYATSGYNVGTGEMLIKIFDSMDAI